MNTQRHLNWNQLLLFYILIDLKQNNPKLNEAFHSIGKLFLLAMSFIVVLFCF